MNTNENTTYQDPNVNTNPNYQHTETYNSANTGGNPNINYNAGVNQPSYGRQTAVTTGRRSWTEAMWCTTTLRILEFASSVLVFALLSFAIHDYHDQ